MDALIALPLLCVCGQLLFVIAFLGLVVLWIVAIVDVVQRTDGEFPEAVKENPGANEKLVWVLVAVLIGPLGGVIYYFMVMKPYPRRPSQSVSVRPVAQAAGPLPAPSTPVARPPMDPRSTVAVGADGEGRVVTYDASTGEFYIAGMRTTIERLLALERTGQLVWHSDEIAAWAARFPDQSWGSRG